MRCACTVPTETPVSRAIARTDLVPASSSIRLRLCSGRGGWPSLVPCARARASPALVRMLMRLRSSLAKPAQAVMALVTMSRLRAGTVCPCHSLSRLDDPRQGGTDMKVGEVMTWQVEIAAETAR